MKNKMKWMLAIGLLSCSMVMAQQQSDITVGIGFCQCGQCCFSF